MSKLTVVKMVNTVADTLGITKALAGNAVRLMLVEIENALLHGDDVSLGSIGTLKHVKRNPRVCRNPKTGDKVDVPAKVTVRLRPSTSLILCDVNLV